MHAAQVMRTSSLVTRCLGPARELSDTRGTIDQLPPDVLVIILTAFMHTYQGVLHNFPPLMVCTMWRKACESLCASVSLCLRELREEEYIIPHSVNYLMAAFQMNRMDHLLDKMKLMHERFPSIEHIAVERASKKDLTWSTLSPVISLFQNLTSISFEAAEVSIDGILEIAKRCRKINRVCLHECHIGDDAVGALATYCELEYVEIDKTQITDDSLRSLAQCPHLQYLDIEETRVTDKGIKSLVRGCKSIRTLIMSGCQITDESAPDIAFLSDLRTLDVLNCWISHEFIAIVTRSCPKISFLMLCDLHGDATLEYAIVPHCWNLIEMHLFCSERHTALSIDGLNCLKGGCPLLRNVNFHFRPLPCRNKKLVEAFESFTKATRKKAQDNARISDYVAQAYAQFDTDQDHTYTLRRTIKL